MAIIASFGIHPAHAITLFSIVAFAALLLAIVGVSEELFHSRLAGLFAVALSLTSSSFRFVHYFRTLDWTEPAEAIQQIAENAAHPFSFSFELASPYGYNGVMFNLFYFIEERQLIVPLILFVLTPVLFTKLKDLSIRTTIALGALLGSLLLWHLYITIAVVAGLAVLLPFTTFKRRVALLLIAAACVMAPQAYMVMQTAGGPEFLEEARKVPRINFGFIADSSLVFSLSFRNFIAFYLYGYGFKLVAAVAGFFILRRRDKTAAYAFAGLILTVFTLTNTVQIAPNSVHENHKWLRPMAVLLDILCAGSLLTLLKQRTYPSLVSCIVLCMFLTLSGVIEAVPFLRSQPSEEWLTYPSDFDSALWRNTAAHDAIATTVSQRVAFAGRRVYVAPPDAWAGTPFVYQHVLDVETRALTQDRAFESRTILELCIRAKTMNVQVIEVLNPFLADLLEGRDPSTVFTAPLPDGPVRFFHVTRGCGPIKTLRLK
jgi:hypothetical protein